MGKGFGNIQVIQGLLIIGAITGFVVWRETPGKPVPKTLVVLHSNSKVDVTPDQWFIFNPAAFQALLPDFPLWVSVKVYNHTQINQFGDKLAVISQIDQQSLLSAETLPLLERPK